MLKTDIDFTYRCALAGFLHFRFRSRFKGENEIRGYASFQ